MPFRNYSCSRHKRTDARPGLRNYRADTDALTDYPWRFPNFQRGRHVIDPRPFAATPVALLLVLLAIPPALAAEPIPDVDTAGLPPRSVPEPVPLRPVPEWLQTHWRLGHLPGSPAMATEFVKAGYNIVTLNVLGKWEVVGPSAKL